jgi:hypothetical protein
MSEQESVTYACQNCKYTNIWTRDEILSRGKKVLMRGDKYEYSLPCKNPKSPACDGRYVVEVERRKE